MQTIQNSDLNELNLEVFKKFKKILNFLKKRSSIIIGLPGWTSLLKFFDILLANSADIDSKIWKKIRFAFVDERIVPLDHKDSNYKQAYDKLFSHLITKWFIKQFQILTPNFKLEDYESIYSQKVNHIDIAFLGVWEDWHTCALFPNNDCLNKNTFWYLSLHNSPKPPSDRLTISSHYFSNISYSFIYFLGENKNQAYKNFLDKNINETQCPAKYALQSQNCYLVTNLE